MLNIFIYSPVIQTVTCRLDVSLCVYAITVNLQNTCAPKCLKAKIPNAQTGEKIGHS